jgi:hypothetical protein
MENLKESLRRAVDGHKELGAWNSRAVEHTPEKLNCELIVKPEEV